MVRRRTTSGSPRSPARHRDTWYAAAEEDGATGIYRSTDTGRTWDLYYRDRS